MSNLAIKHKIAFSKNKKFIRKSKYKYVSVFDVQGVGIAYSVRLQRNNIIFTSHHIDEKEAAKYVDLFLIRQGFDPINILKRL